MKKILNTTLLSISLISASRNALAETIGNYVGLNLTHIDVVGGVREYKKDLGATYGYALNMNKFIILPELYYSFGLADTLHETYGFRMNLGYDFSPEYSLYATLGANSNNSFSKRESMTYGLSFKADLNDYFSLKANMDIRDGEKNLEILNISLSYNF